MKKEKKFYVVHDENFARVLKWICREDWYVFTNDDGKAYSFRYTDKFKQALEIAQEIKNKVR